jgi:hypothetical protein
MSGLCHWQAIQPPGLTLEMNRYRIWEQQLVPREWKEVSGDQVVASFATLEEAVGWMNRATARPWETLG